MKKVVIIGGGFAGVEVAGRLEKDFEVTLIDMKDYFECTVGDPSAILNPSYLDGMTVPYRSIFRYANIIKAKVTEVTKDEVVCGEGRVPYDYLCIASGSGYSFPIKPETESAIEERKSAFEDVNRRLREAKDILVIGGGPVGVEVAAGIASQYRGKSLTLIESGPRLLSRLHRSAQEYAEKFFLEKKVRLLLNERIMEQHANTYESDKGSSIDADMVFNCIGIKPNTGFLIPHFLENLDDRRRIKVNRSLQLEGHPYIFALGDCNNIQEEKLAINAKRHATLTVDNILRLNRGIKLQPYAVSKLSAALIGLGNKKAIMATPWRAFGGNVPHYFKSLEVPLLMKTLTWSYPQFIWKVY
jgi:NADH dehydrogenase FAD-containing subunit